MKGERKRKLIFQGLVCTFSQPTMGDAGASSYLTGHQVPLKSLRPQGQGTATSSGTSSGSLEWSNLLCSPSCTAEGVTGRAHCKVCAPWLLCPWVTRARLGKVTAQDLVKESLQSNSWEREMKKDRGDESVFCLLRTMWSWAGNWTSLMFEGLVWGLQTEHRRWPKQVTMIAVVRNDGILAWSITSKKNFF